MTKELDAKLERLKELQAEIENLEATKTSLRAELLDTLKIEDIKIYKNDFCSISYVERKTIKIKDREEVIGFLVSNNLKNFLDFIPEKIEHEHYELNKDFDDRVKKGVLKIEGVEVMVTELPQIKFN